MSDVVIRAARDTDAEGLIALIGAVYSEYPGCVLDVDNEEPDLREIAKAYREQNGRFWVALEEASLVGSVGVKPGSDATSLELKKLYVARRARRRGLGTRLLELAEAELSARGLTRMELWTDTRFEDAHRLMVNRRRSPDHGSPRREHARRATWRPS